MIVSHETKKKKAVCEEQVSYLHVTKGIATIEATEADASPKKLLPSSVGCTSQLYNKPLLSIRKPV